MKYLWVILILIGIYALFQAVCIFYFTRISKILVEKAIPFSIHSNDVTKTLLIIGDSLAVGVGASDGAHSIAGLISQDFPYDITNLSVSGDKLSDGLKVADTLQDKHYDIIMIQLGANDILHFTAKSKALAQAKQLLTIAEVHANKVIFMTSGSVGHAPIFFPPLSSIYTARTRSFTDAFAALSQNMNVTYIDLFIEGSNDPFLKDPKTYYAKDGLHLSDEGYAFWYRKIKQNF